MLSPCQYLLTFSFVVAALLVGRLAVLAKIVTHPTVVLTDSTVVIHFLTRALIH